MTQLALNSHITTKSLHVDRLPIRVVVAAGPTVVCEALASRLSCEDDLLALSVPGSRSTSVRWMDALVSLAPDVIIVDPAESGDGEEGFIERIHAVPGDPSVLALVDKQDAKFAAELVRAGAAATVVKSAPANELVAATRSVARGDSWISPPLLRDVLNFFHGGSDGVQNNRFSHFTSREREIVQLMVDGLGRRQIAQRLFLSIDTVRTHMRTIMEKLNVHSATEVVSAALSAGLRPDRNRTDTAF
jgi:DNA-binding NarL/FixJ family response regulator